MATSPEKSNWVKAIRKPFYAVEKYLPGNFNPNIWTVAMIGSSIVYLYTWYTKPWNILLIIICMVFDWLDGAYARKNKTTSLEGHIIDISFDKISEVIILTPLLGTWFGTIMFIFFLANIYLTKRIFTTGKHFHFNIRFLTILYLLFI